MLEETETIDTPALIPPETLILPKPQRKIAIFGTTPSRAEGPIQDDSGWERWTIGPGGKNIHNWERLYEVHGTWPADFKDYLNDLSKVKLPRQVVVLPQPDCPADTWENAIDRWKRMHKIDDGVIEGNWESIVRYPREKILEKYQRRMWFSSSISWLIVQAIEEQPTDIGLWGIDLESGEEYISQFVGCAHFIDLAILAGINVHLPLHSGLRRDPMPYPDRYETHLALTFEKKAIWLQMALNQMEPQFEEIRAESHRCEGRLLLGRELGADAKILQETEIKLINLHKQVGALAANINQLKGELNATQYYRRMYVWGVNDATDKP